MNKIVLGEGRVIMQVEGNGTLVFYKSNKAFPVGKLEGKWDDNVVDMVPILEIEGSVEGFQVLLSSILDTVEVIERCKLNNACLAV